MFVAARLHCVSQYDDHYGPGIIALLCNCRQWRESAAAPVASLRVGNSLKWSLLSCHKSYQIFAGPLQAQAAAEGCGPVVVAVVPALEIGVLML